jgi:hypothetical protein
MTTVRDNIIPIYVNSTDRTNLSDPTTNFSVSLRKSLYNISSVSLSDIVIPRTDTDINVNNNIISGAIIQDGVRLPFSIVIGNGGYTNMELAAELETKFNDDELSIALILTWTFTYVAPYIAITLLNPLGPTYSTWSVFLAYSELIDIVGIGDETHTSSSIDGSGLDTLIIPTNRAPYVNSITTYNITSDVLTSGFNTSYINSLAKNFSIDSSNNVLSLLTSQQASSFSRRLSNGITNSAQLQGVRVDMSDDGNIIVISSNAQMGAIVFTRISVNGTWQQRTSTLVPPNLADAIFDVSISGDGDTISLCATSSDTNKSAVWVYTKVNSITWELDFGPFYPSDGNQEMRLVVLNDDGSTIVGSDLNVGSVGAVWSFTRSGSVWTQETAMVQPSDNAGSAFGTGFGSSIAISGDGNVMAVGGGFEDTFLGAVWVFTRSVGVWSQQGLKLRPAAIVANSLLGGTGIALSNDGTTMVVGAINYNGNSIEGGAWVYTESGGVWSIESELVPTGTASTDSNFGSSIAISSDGNTVAVGGSIHSDVSNEGGVWVFTRSVGVWSEEVAELRAGDTEPSANLLTGNFTAVGQGYSLAMDNSGDLIASGGILDRDLDGSTFVFERTITDWAQKFSKLVGIGDTIGSSEFGFSVASDGETLVIGGPNDNLRTGVVWFFRRSGYNWIEESSIVVDDFDVGSFSNLLGYAVDVYGDIAVMGAWADALAVGGTWVFKKINGSWEQYTSVQRGSGFVDSKPYLGKSIAIHGDTYVAGAPSDGGGGNPDIGAAVVWVGPVWKQQGNPLVGTGAIGTSGQGESVSIYGDTIVVGGPDDDSGVGAVWVFTRSGDIWTQLGEKIVPSGGLGAGEIGTAVKIYENTLIIGAPKDNGGVGAIWFYTFNGVDWVADGARIPAPGDAVGSSLFGTSIDYDGEVAIIGAPDDNGVGAIWLFERGESVWSEIGAKRIATDYTGEEFGVSVSIGISGEYFVGDPGADDTIGAVTHIITKRTAFPQSINTVTIPDRSYTINDLTTTIDTLLNTFDPNIQYSATFNGTSFTIASVPTSVVVHNTFVVDESSTITFVAFPQQTSAQSQSSSIIDFTINNSVLRSVVMRHENAENVIWDNGISTLYRKYDAGFVLDYGSLIDIQIRDSRDRVVDLNGVNWSFTMYITVFS